MSQMPATALTPLEVATGLILGTLAGENGFPRPRRVSARVGLERAVLDAVARPPCFVSFSGGRVSSAVLALASHVARTEGLPLPILATNVFPAVALADENRWQ